MPFLLKKINPKFKRSWNFLYNNCMTKHNTIQVDYTISENNYQLKSLLNIDSLIPKDDSVRLLSQIIEEMNLEKLYQTYSRIRGNSATTRQLLKIVIYANMNNISSFILKCENDFGIKVIYKNKIKKYHLKKLLKKLKRLSIKENIVFVHGKGRRKSLIQKAIEKLNEYINRLKKYTKDLYIMGQRNIYSKTDKDATFMRMKEDHMRNGQLKPAYNVQFGVDSEYIVWASVGPQTTDTTTLIPFLKSIEKLKYSKVIADSGYESEENYVFLEDNQQLSFLKTSDYEIKKTKKYRNDIGRKENMIYCEKDDYYICKNNKKLYVSGTINRKSKTEYKSKITCYTCEDCSNCEYKKKCIKGNNSKIPIEQRTKNLQVSKLFHKKQKENLERITNPEGRKLRMNRSIQAEGAFAQVKQNMQFKRFLSRGNKNVLSDGVYFYILKVNFPYKTLKNTLNLS